ncbi:inositol polyphosphate-5-phosphatase A-like isoform X2 [Patiria miniata]|uniref:inositol-polyphosphate 5-phosphatase n=1 Tax=Patiria miniata TaxID=46514 RepID=A0A913Z0R2_PATMI|nr:inositol polyphosphate-5-phosphatase A-like isoform X2 [Patiria miniata]
MASESLPSVMLITANVGSIFEDPETMLQGWLHKFYESVQTLKPQLIAVHMQEVGGKDFEQCMGNVDAFVQSLIDSEALKSFDRSLVFLDKDFALVDQFTALGNLYFVHESLQNVQLYDFKTCRFNTIQGKQFVNLINKKTIYEKAKFPQNFFPGTVWSRKGFLRTRWNVENRIFDLANIHLFHDASNMVAMETFPSPYCKYRKRALEHVLQRFSKDKHDNVPLFLFGDFNFRLDSQGVIQTLVAEATPEYTKEDKEVTRITYKDCDGSSKVILILEKKRFEIDDPDRLIGENAKWLLPFDKEMKCFTNQLYEYDRDFPPSYPYSEDVTDGRSYMKTRVPAWCDRILLSKAAKALVKEDLYNKAMYSVIGQEVCMGDHKPIFLSFRLAPTQVTPYYKVSGALVYYPLIYRETSV